MVNVVKEENGGILTIRLSGSIEESVDFNGLIGDVGAQQVVVNTKGVTRINSVGVKAWITYFQTLVDKGIQLTFAECSTAIVEQVNLISNFVCDGTVDSIYVPFSCENCKTELVGLFKSDAIQKLNFEIPNLKCSKCGGEAVFDDIPEEYFNFLMN